MTEIKDQMLDQVTGGRSYWSRNAACENFEPIDPNDKNTMCLHCIHFQKSNPVAPKVDGRCIYSYLDHGKVPPQ